jgi:hypothetical protein
MEKNMNFQENKQILVSVSKRFGDLYNLLDNFTHYLFSSKVARSDYRAKLIAYVLSFEDEVK